ncbi:MAG: hypothetical protein ACJAVH_002077 [Bacteroidia bacterium]|jgi:hypothetical protein
MCFLTFWTYAVRKLLMSRRVVCHLFDGLCGGNKKRKGGIYSEGKVVIENTSRASVQAVNFYGLHD